MIASIHHIALATADLDAALRDHAAMFGRPPDGEIAADGTRQAWFSTANIRYALIAPDGAGGRGDAVRKRLSDAGEGLWSIAWRVDDLDRTADLFARRGLAPGEAQDLNIHGHGDAHTVRARALSVEATHGVQSVLVAAPPETAPAPVAAAPHRLDHVVIRTADPERAVALYGGRFGLDLRLDRSSPQWGVRFLFFRAGDLVVEIVHELKAGVSQKPDFFGGLSWGVQDIEATRARLLAAGRNLSEVRKGRKPGSQVCTLRDGTAGVPTILLGQERLSG
ncbi:MAG: VOC family protein [Rhodoblastus sp.]